MNIKITRQEYQDHTATLASSKRTDWLDGFANSIVNAAEKPTDNAVEAARARQSQSVIDSIRSIVSKEPVFSSVAGKVQDLQERIGLKEWMKRKEIIAAITAEASIDEQLKVDIEIFVKNKIETRHGNIHVPALQEDVLTLFKSRGITAEDVEDPNFEAYLFNEIRRIKDMNPAHDNLKDLGKGVGVGTDSDRCNSDFFDSLSPTKI